MDEPEVIVHSQGNGQLRSWPDAYMAFLRNPSENRALKLVPLALIGIVPVSILDEIIPFIGVLDDIPTIILVVITFIMTQRRVRHYR